MNDSEQSVAAETPAYPGLLRWPPFWFFIFLALAASAIGYAMFQQHKENTRQEELKLLSTIADLRVDAITKWKAERKGDAEVFMRGVFFPREVEKWLQRGAPPDENRQVILERMKAVQSAYGYHELFLLDAQGKPFLSTLPDATSPGSYVLEMVKKAIRMQAVVFLDIGPHEKPQDMGVIAPLLITHDGKPRTIGAIYLQIDSSRFLFPLLKATLSASKSLEVVLAHREGDEVVLLNVPSANGDATLLRQPLSKSKLPTVMAVLGSLNRIEGIDYRDVPVFAELRKIPGSDWALVAKVDQEEIYAPLRELAWLVAGAIAALLTLSGAALYLLWRSQRAQFLLAKQKQTERDLRIASAYTRSLIEASLDPLVTISPAGKITDVNNATEKVTGRSRADLIGTDFSDYFTEPGKAREGYRKAFSEGAVTDYPLAIRHRDGHITDVLYNASLYRNQAGEVLGVLAAARDVTERKRAEGRLRISEERLALAVHTGNIGIWDWDIPENKLTWDESMYRLYGIRRNDFGGAYEAWAKTLHPEDKAHVDAEIQAALRGEREYAPEFRVIWPDGSVHYLKAASHTLFDDQGKPVRMIGINYDLTERKLAEHELREKEERLALATIHNGVGVWDWNLITQEMIWDDSMYALYRIRREDFIGTEEAWRAALHPDDLHRGDSEVNDAIAGIKPFDTTFRVVWPGGEIRHIKAVAKVFRNEQGTPLRMLGINMDITERKQAEEEVRHLNVELELRVTERTAQLAAANKELEAFAYSVSHDLRVPLRAIDGFSHMILTRYEEKLDDEGKRLLNVVRDNTSKMGHLIDDILAFSRTGRLEMKASEVNMEELARDVWQELETLLAGREVHLNITPLCKIRGDPAMLRQVFANLLGNAVKFTNIRAVANIEVGSSAQDGECVFHVKDNGAGFDQQYAHKLFGVFQRLHGIDEFEGTGIGLAIVKRIITRHGGRVWAEGRVNEGATIYFALPQKTEQ